MEFSNKKCSCETSKEIDADALKSIVPVEYKYVQCDFKETNSGEFVCRFRINLFTKDDATNWLEEFMMSSKMTFKKAKTFPENSQTNVYKVVLRCHHNTRPPPNTKTPHAKHTNCPARMILTVKKQLLTEQYRSKDIHLKEFPTIIILHCIHNHSIDSAAALKFRDPTINVKEAFQKMFQAGYTPSRAYNVYIADIQEEYGDSFHLIAADRAICPDMRWVYYTYYQVFKKEYGEASGDGMLDSLKSYVTKYNIEQKGKYSEIKEFSDGNFAVILVTPMMKRIMNNIPETGELLFADSTGNIDRYGCKVFLLLTNSCSGGLPVGTIITTSEKQEVISSCLESYKSFVEDSSFGGRGVDGPKVIMTDDCKSERNSFGHVFPQATLLLCVFHVLQACWRYLCNTQVCVPAAKRQEIFFWIKKLVYAPSTMEFHEIYDQVQLQISAYPKLLEYVCNLHERKEEWALCFRKNFILRGQNTNNICEAAMRVLKEPILLRKKAYSPTQLFDFLISDLDNFYSRKLISVANGRIPQYLKKKVAYDRELENHLLVEQVSSTFYNVHNSSTKSSYSVDTEIGVCSCPVGQSGILCKHQRFIFFKFNVNFHFCPLSTDAEWRKKLLFIATGVNNALPSEWFAPLQSNSTDTYRNCSEKEQSLERERLSISTQSDFPIQENETLPTTSDACVETSIQAQRDRENKIMKGFDDIKEMIKENPHLFTAAEAFLTSFNKIKTENGIVSAFHTFNKYGGLKTRKNMVTSKNIGVQPTAMARRKTPCGGRLALQSGRPPKRSFTSEHGYFQETQKSTLLPNKKRKIAAPHNISKCVEKNIPLGKKH